MKHIPNSRSFALLASALVVTTAVAPTAGAQSSLSSSLPTSLLGSSSGSSNSSGSSRPGDDAPAGTGDAGETLWSESFDEVPNPVHFTHKVPEGWASEDTGVTSGEARWKGWTLTDIRHWTWAAGTDMRHWFTGAHDQIAVIDSKQQRLNATDSMDAGLITPDIPVAAQDRVALTFDHHYRQGSPDQKATVTVSFDGGEGDVVKQYTADEFSAHENLNVEVPAGAQDMKVRFDYLGGNDDWWWAIDNVAVSEPLGELPGEPESIVDVLSDIQGDTKEYQQAIRHLNAMEDKADALVLNGDLVNTGEQHLWDEFLAAHRAEPHDAEAELWTIGNHEMYGPDGSEKNLERFLKYSGQDKPYTEKMAGGVPLISINTEYYSDVDRDGKEPFQRLSEEQLNWLDERVGYWTSRGVTPLVFTHPVLPQTVSMTHSAWYQNDFEDLEALSNVLNKYNNIVAFTSHTHSSLQQNDWWGMRRYDGTGEAGKKGFPVVNTGAITNEYRPGGDHDETIVDEGSITGLRVKTYSDRVRVEAWDFRKNEMIKYQDFAR
ncbi:metallophosphoesterase [Corynebacterium incognita]|uniref:Metallophosphoesterase n=1 Tax=Corynebacterium incognita TaxID=2754725 RepID=A0A7G7CRG4_9CORY|nr:metallophosphoesterase [Corynebacterium incognita]QNE90180.1 metallophosphoesterase [Corynebacterium incognita]